MSSQAENPAPVAPAPPRRRSRWLIALLVLALLLVAVAAIAAHWEMRTSTFQARYLTAWANRLGFKLEPGASDAIAYPKDGPYDERLGYTRVGESVERLASRGFRVTSQVRQSDDLRRYVADGYFPPFAEKSQAGLRVLDCRNDALFSTRFPQYVYERSADIPALVANTLVFIENRQLLADVEPKYNPAVEWPRLGRAVLDKGISYVKPGHQAPGGSTLATQFEKYRHSSEGRTATVSDKFKQMISASVRAYSHGEETEGARHQILLDYINSVPLGALRGYGEVHGLLDGLAAWYGADVDAANRALRAAPVAPTESPAANAALQARALAYRQVVSLLIAQRRPSHYFGNGQDQLAQMTDSYLRVLADAGVIDAPLRDAALRLRPRVQDVGSSTAGAARILDQKAANRVRFELATLLDTPLLYTLDRTDLTVGSTIDGRLQDQITQLLTELRKPKAAQAAGLVGFQLLERGDPSQLLYSFTLYERDGGVNRLRVQTDNLDQPFDINGGAKLELGSTAKLRTLISHLEAVAALHAKYVVAKPRELRKVPVARQDRLTRWAIDYLAGAQDRTLAAMLEAAMERRYSASPTERFFTGGGVHHFDNFHWADNDKTPTLRESLRDSVNLVFVRLLRDLVQHHIYRDPEAVALFDGSDADGRVEYLERFAEREGLVFTRTYYRRYAGKAPADVLTRLAASVRHTPNRLAVAYRSVRPEGSFEDFSAYLRKHLAPSIPSDESLASLDEQHAPGSYSLHDRGYLAGIHPLELWVARQVVEKQQVSWAQIVEAGKDERQDVYQWLFRTRHTRAQDRRIQSLLEIDAFAEIQQGWARLGYPFDTLVPSYATALGSSGDRPAALAELMGIVVNDGMRLPTAAIDRMHFAAKTPYETALRLEPPAAERMLPSELANVVRGALALVVEKGTARRVSGAFDTEGAEPVVIGGKTGTGDNRTHAYRSGGRFVEARILNRTATFVFYIGDRHFGTLTAYVPGPQAKDFRFTSALPVQILKTMAPLLKPVVSPARPTPCTESVAAVAEAAPLPTRREAALPGN